MADLFETTDWEERVRAIAILPPQFGRAKRWHQLSNESGLDREQFLTLIRLAPDTSCLIFARGSTIRRLIGHDQDIRDAFDLRLKELSGFGAPVAISR